MYITVVCSMYIATRRARLGAREAGFLVFNNGTFWYLVEDLSNQLKLQMSSTVIPFI